MSSEFKKCKGVDCDKDIPKGLIPYCSYKCRDTVIEPPDRLKKRKARKSTTSVTKRLKKELWFEFSRYIRMRDALKTTGDIYNLACVTCETVKPTISVDAGHFITSVKSYIKFDEKNVHGQCKKCNMPPDPGEQYLYSLAMVNMYGQAEIDRLQSERNLIKKWTQLELEYAIEHYRLQNEEWYEVYGKPWAN